MGAALGFAAIVIVLGIFMPDVLHSLTVFLLTLLAKGTAFIQSVPAGPADVSRVVPQ